MDAISRYLSGEDFDDDYRYQPRVAFAPLARGDLLEQWCAGRSVLHVGFADHQPLIAARVADGGWLHARLSRSARQCHGIDINRQAVEAARVLGFQHVHALDIHAADSEGFLRGLGVDLVMVPDVLEHLGDPAAFMARLAQIFPAADFVVSVPNGLALRNAVNMLGGVERVNTDHRAWFSPYTLSKVLADAGLRVEELRGCMVSPAGSLKGRLLRGLVRRRPLGADVLVARARVTVP
ncbi:SAM-dependent methyltransferase [Paracidovorax avenae]|nr:SAM-dependent methyltransferase [Paracidovorax avenae]